MIVTSAGMRARALAASSPPKPAPMMTICGTRMPSGCGGALYHEACAETRAGRLLPLAGAFAGALPARAFLRNLLALAARLGEADRDRLFAALHFFLAAAASQRALLALAHRAFDVLGSAFGILACHHR